MKFAKFLRTPFLKKTCERLLLVLAIGFYQNHKDDVLKADQLYSSNQNTLLLIGYKVPIALLMSAVFV